MALHLSNLNVAHEIAARIRMLIARQDDGDITRAARRLDCSIADVYLPERIISSGDEPAALAFLATIVRTYEADACWLITGTTGSASLKRDDATAAASSFLTDADPVHLSAEARVVIVELLEELSDHLLHEVRTDRLNPRSH
jgi:hypothetical protein